MCRAVRFLQTLVFCAATLVTLAGICVRSLHAQDARPIPAPSMALRGIPEDWSNRHVIYTRNGSFEDMVKVRDDPRFINSLRLHNTQEHPSQTKQAAATELFKKKNSKVDWSISLGHWAGMAIGETPAKYTFDPDAPPTCTNLTAVPPTIGDFVVFTIDVPTGHVAAASQGNLVGITNLYSGSPAGPCGTHPTFLFSYAIGSNGSQLSPVISGNGAQIAWIENASPAAILHVTTWAPGQGTNATVRSVAIGSGSSDVTLNYTTSTSNPNCVTTSSTNTNSDLYVDYQNNVGYIGADNGILYHINNLFGGTPTVDFCTVASALPLGSPVYDSESVQVFVSDPLTLYSYTVGSSSFTNLASYGYGAGGASQTSGPMLDSFDGYVYMFSADDTNHHTSMTQLPISMASAAVVSLGPASTAAYPILYLGAFDNNYFNNGPSSSSTIYTCGADPTNPLAQDLYAIGFTAGPTNPSLVMTANPNVNTSHDTGTCSPITEFYDGTTDRIFVGMGDPNYVENGDDGADIVTMWDVTTQLTDPTTTPTATSAADYFGGTTGFPIDNNAIGTAQAESIYFSTLAPIPSTDTFRCFANHFCAVKLTQSGLQ